MKTSTSRREGTQPMPTRIAPMLALLTKTLPRVQMDYHYEIKWDGMRTLTYWDGRHLRLRSRTDHEQTHRFPELAGLGKAIGKQPTILDGEIVAMDEHGKPSFAILTKRMHLQGPVAIRAAQRAWPVIYAIFDVLYRNNASVIHLSFVDRREVLNQMRLDGAAWQISTAVAGQGTAMLSAAKEQSLEGIIAKRSDSPYEPGRRSGAWLKLKLITEQEFVIGGWTPEATAGPKRVGALLLGYYDVGRFRYAGRVGTGFDRNWHARLTEQLRSRECDRNPFAEELRGNSIRFVRPELVAQIEYRRWPRGQHVQQSAFKGLREDREPKSVTDERS